MNLVGHVAVAMRSRRDASTGLLVGAMLPDLASIARIHLVPAGVAATPESPAAHDMAVGIALHHDSDAAFHGSRWFHEHNQALRDLLLDAGVDRGAARACAHAGLEMLLDGVLMADAVVARSTDDAFAALTAVSPTRAAAVASVAPDQRAQWDERLDQIGRSLDPRAYASAADVATRLHRMTRGRPRIELRAEHVTLVEGALERYRPRVAVDGPTVVDETVTAVLATT